MARLPKPSKNYDPLNMARELSAAIDASKPVPKASGTVPDRSGTAPRDYRRTLFESLFT